MTSKTRSTRSKKVIPVEIAAVDDSNDETYETESSAETDASSLESDDESEYDDVGSTRRSVASDDDTREY